MVGPQVLNDRALPVVIRGGEEKTALPVTTGGRGYHTVVEMSKVLSRACPTYLRSDEELREPVEPSLEEVRTDVKIVHRVFGVGVSVAGTSVRAQIIRVAVVIQYD